MPWLGAKSESVGLQDWLDIMSTYIKELDPNHLVYYGAAAYFGASSPGQCDPYFFKTMFKAFEVAKALCLPTSTSMAIGSHQCAPVVT